MGAVAKAFIGSDSLAFNDNTILATGLGQQYLGVVPFTQMMQPGILGLAFATTAEVAAVTQWTQKLMIRKYSISAKFTNFTDAPITLELMAVAPRSDWLATQSDPTVVLREGFGQNSQNAISPTALNPYNSTNTYATPNMSVYHNPAFVHHFKVKATKRWTLRPGQSKTWTRVRKRVTTLQFNRLMNQTTTTGIPDPSTTDYYNFLKGWTFLVARFMGSPVASGTNVSYSVAKVGVISTRRIEFSGFSDTGDTRYYLDSTPITGSFYRPVNPVHSLSVNEIIPTYVP